MVTSGEPCGVSGVSAGTATLFRLTGRGRRRRPRRLATRVRRGKGIPKGDYNSEYIFVDPMVRSRRLEIRKRAAALDIDVAYASAQPPPVGDVPWRILYAVAILAVGVYNWTTEISYRVHLVTDVFLIVSMLGWSFVLCMHRDTSRSVYVASWIAMHALVSTLKGNWERNGDTMPWWLSIHVVLYVTQGMFFLWGLKSLVVF